MQIFRTIILGNHHYDINKRGDQQVITRAMLIAYKKVGNPDFYNQLKFLHFEENMQIPKYTLDIISALIKTTI